MKVVSFKLINVHDSDFQGSPSNNWKATYIWIDLSVKLNENLILFPMYNFIILFFNKIKNLLIQLHYQEQSCQFFSSLIIPTPTLQISLKCHILSINYFSYEWNSHVVYDVGILDTGISCLKRIREVYQATLSI